MKTISAEELKEKLDRGDDFKLAMALGDFAFQRMHIPGSINLHSVREALKILDPEDEIVVYCSDVRCVASKAAYEILTGNGYTNVRRFSGGLVEWEANGYALEGQSVRKAD